MGAFPRRRCFVRPFVGVIAGDVIFSPRPNLGQPLAFNENEDEEKEQAINNQHHDVHVDASEGVPCEEALGSVTLVLGGRYDDPTIHHYVLATDGKVRRHQLRQAALGRLTLSMGTMQSRYLSKVTIEENELGQIDKFLAEELECVLLYARHTQVVGLQWCSQSSCS